MSLPIACPAATEVTPPGHGPSVVCGVLEISNHDAQLGGYRARGQVPALISGRHDLNQVADYCAGSGMPGSMCSYTACAIWRAEKHRIDAARKAGQHGLRDEEAIRAPELDRELLAEAMGQAA